MSVPTSLSIGKIITNRAINRTTTGSSVRLGKIIRFSTKFRGRNSRANGDIRAITPTLRPTAKCFTSANAAGKRTRSFVRTARYSIRRLWSACGGTPWIAPARKVSTPLTRRLQKQWRKLIGEHALRNELFKIHTVYTVRPYGIRMRLHNRHLLISRGLITKKNRCNNISFKVPVELSRNKMINKSRVPLIIISTLLSFEQEGNHTQTPPLSVFTAGV